MSIKARRERQKQATREGILNAALQIARTDGWAAVTVRRVAERIEYTPPIIYQYFANKSALLEELQERGFAMLADAIQQATANESDPKERLLKVGDAYIQFAYEQPELYQLMHGMSSAEVTSDKTFAWASRAAGIVQESFETWAAERKVTVPDKTANLETIWALLHGLVSIETLGRIGGGEERVRQMARRGLEDLLSTWAAKM